MNRKNIVIIAKNPEYYISGPSIFAGILSKQLLKYGHSVSFLYPEMDLNTCEKIYSLPKQNEKFTIYNVKRILNDKFPSQLMPSFTKIALEDITKDMKHIDYIFLIYPFPAAIDVHSFSKKNGIKIINFLRGTDVITWMDPKKYEVNLSMKNWVIDKYIKSINESYSVCAVSNWLKNAAFRHGINRVDHITYPPITNYGQSIRNTYTKDSMELKKLLKKNYLLDTNYCPKTDEIISYAGRIHSDKNIKLIVDIFSEYITRNKKRSSSCFLVIAGYGNYKKDIVNHIKMRDIEDDVAIICMKYNDIYSLARVSSCGINMSFPNENNNNFIEAISSSAVIYSGMGTPIIFPHSTIIDCGGINESISQENINYLHIDIDDENYIMQGAKRIERLLNDRNFYNMISARNENFSNKFSIALTINPLIESL